MSIKTEYISKSVMFDTDLDVYFVGQKVKYILSIFHKNGSLYKLFDFSSSFTLDEIMKRRKEYPNKQARIQIKIIE
jgi:hypothetical protein